MKHTSQSPTAQGGFTLIELLTVIAIIAILMALLFPAIGAVKELARKADAKNTNVGILAAIKNYQVEYGKYPSVGATSASDDVIVGDAVCPGRIAANSALFDTLRAIDRGLNSGHSLNPKKVVFFEKGTVSDPATPKGGFLEKGGDAALLGCLFDPWGKQFNVIMDTNNDNYLSVDQVYQDPEWKTDGRPHVGVGAFSFGKDNVVGDKKKSDSRFRNGQTVSDDAVSWN